MTLAEREGPERIFSLASRHSTVKIRRPLSPHFLELTFARARGADLFGSVPSDVRQRVDDLATRIHLTDHGTPRARDGFRMPSPGPTAEATIPGPLYWTIDGPSPRESWRQLRRVRSWP